MQNNFESTRLKTVAEEEASKEESRKQVESVANEAAEKAMGTERLYDQAHSIFSK